MRGEHDITECPQCHARIHGQRMDLRAVEFVWRGCGCTACGWDSEHRPELLSYEESVADLVARGHELASITHGSDTSFATDAMFRTQPQQLRERADFLDRRDGIVRGFKWALARLDAFTTEAATAADSEEVGRP